MKQRLILIITVITLLVPWQVGTAQNAIIFTSLEIDLWPEYDRPDMLVIYRIKLAPEVPLPTVLSINIPAAAGEPNAIAVQDPSGSLLNAPYERAVNGDWAQITMTASMPDIQIEYYDPQIVFNGSERSYQFTWGGNYPTENLFIQLQQPFGAEQVNLVPPAARTTQGSDGLTYHTIDLGPQPAGLETSVSIAYVKDSDALTVEHFEIQSSAPISERTSGRVRILDVLPWGLGLLGVLLLVGGLWWYWQTGREKPKARRSKRGQRSRRKQPTFQVKNGAKSDQDSQKTADNAVYCHQCGKRAETGDRFCRSCGTKLRAT